MMKSTLLTAVASALVLTTGALADFASNPITTDDFARVQEISSVSMSFEGDLITAVVAEPGSDGQRTALATWDLTDPDLPVVVTPANDRMDFWGASALKGGVTYAFTRQPITGEKSRCLEGGGVGGNKVWVTTAYLTDREHSDFEVPFQRSSRSVGSLGAVSCEGIGGGGSLMSILPLDPEHVIISAFDSSASRTRYYKYNVTNGSSTFFPISVPAGAGMGLLHPVTGRPLSASRFEPSESDFEIQIFLQNPATGELEIQPPLLSMASERITAGITGYDVETGDYYVVTDKFSNLDQVYIYNAETQTFSDEPVLAHPQFDVAGLVFSNQPSNFNQIVGFQYHGAYFETEWIDPTLIQIQEALEQRFEGLRVEIDDWNDGYQQVLFSTGHPDGPASYYLMSDFSEIRLLGHSRPHMDDYEFAETELVYYPARDGLMIPGLLSTPVGWTTEDGPLPTIINPHGGPWARDYGGYDMWTQFFTSRGHAVLRPQYRGSTNMGRELWLAGDAQWGLSMQDDKDDGAAWLVEQGIADPDKIAIMGYSYGGFAAMAAVVRPDGPYQCAIAGAGVSNLDRLGNNWSSNRLQRAIQGDTVTGMSPHANTDKADIPTLIFHGDYDVRVEPFHSEDFYDAIKDTVDAELVLYDEMGHQSNKWYSHHIRDHLNLMEEYLTNDCGPGGLYQ